MKLRIGSWDFPSGNNCEVDLERDAIGVTHLYLAWNTPPPLSAEDYTRYMAVVLPALIETVGSVGQGGTA